MTKLKELARNRMKIVTNSLSVVGECEEECELLNQAEQFLNEKYFDIANHRINNA